MLACIIGGVWGQTRGSPRELASKDSHGRACKTTINMGQSANQGASTNSNGDTLDEFHAWRYASGNNRLMSRFKGDWSDGNSFDWRCT